MSRNWDRPLVVIVRSSGGTPRGFPVDRPGLVSNLEQDRARSMTQDRPGNSPDGGVRTSLRIILETKRGSSSFAVMITAQWCLSCAHAQTRNSCKKLRNNLSDRPACSRKRRFRPQQFAQRKSALSGLSTLFIPSEPSRGAEHGHSLPSAQSPLPCTSPIVATSASYGGGLAVERPCRLRHRH